jgi:hypothetical protein
MPIPDSSGGGHQKQPGGISMAGKKSARKTGFLRLVAMIQKRVNRKKRESRRKGGKQT